MMIKSIQFSNFCCYKDTHPVINFSIDTEKNVTVILGANKSGKTTLVQAFLWCLYGEFNPKNGVINSEVRVALDNHSSKDVFVEIILIHADREYTIRRTQTFSKVGGRVRSDDSILKIQYKESNGEQHSIERRNCDDTIKNILPQGLSDYFFYEGERFDDISKKDVATAVKGLMGLDAISTARERLDPSRAASVTSKFRSRLSLGNSQENDNLKRSLEKYQSESERIQERIDNSRSEYEFYLRRKSDLEEKLSQNEDAKKLQAKRNSLEDDIKYGQENIENAGKRILSDFQQKALSFFTLPFIDSALSSIDKSKNSGVGIPEMRQAAIDHILARDRCICGLELSENEGARKRILTERGLLPPEYLGTIVHNFKISLLNYREFSEGFVNLTQANYNEWRKSINFLDDKNEDLKKISEEIKKSGAIDINSIEDEYQRTNEKLKELFDLREKLIEDKGRVKNEIENLEKKIASLVEKTDSNRKLQNYIAYSEALYNWFDASYVKREKEVKNDLNESVNRIFSTMYNGHRIVSINDNYQIRLLINIGSENEELADTGGLKAIKNFAYISGLVDIARKNVKKAKQDNEDDENIVNKTEPYPLVMDAPFSATDENHISNIAKIIPGIAEQVIIILMKKDWFWAKSAIEHKIGKSYIIKNVDNSETCSEIVKGE